MRNGSSIVRRGLSTAQTITVVIVVVLVLLSCLGVALALGLLLPALTTARDAAMAVRSQSQLRMVEQSIQLFHEGENRFPASVDELIAENYITPEILDSGFDWNDDGRGDYWILLDRSAYLGLSNEDEAGLRVDDPGSFVVSYDRSMYAGQRVVATCFLDRSCDVMEWQAFDGLLQAPINEGRDFDLPERTRGQPQGSP
ncbi:MAG: hypothetical protein EA377_12795 [Phycisphaerales bacterium]|nr:MAG: hypothetical protein EA377_12795 [Phycisphaerales bacterium]